MNDLRAAFVFVSLFTAGLLLSSLMRGGELQPVEHAARALALNAWFGTLATLAVDGFRSFLEELYNDLRGARP
jgi:hypothetical protein